MRTGQRPAPLIQRDLFQMPPTRPRWKTLPPEIRQQVLPMLVRLLKEHRVAKPAFGSGKGVSDE